MKSYIGQAWRLVLLASIFPILSHAQDATAVATASPASVTDVAPACAQPCIQGAQQAQSQCSQTDQACLCQQSSTIVDGISSCLANTKACSESDLQSAVAYYPHFCANYDLSPGGTAAATGAGGLVTAAGEAPTQTSGGGTNDLVLTNTATGAGSTKTITADDSNNHSGTGLTVPAILGITLGVFLVVCGIAAFVIYTHVRRRQLKRRTRLEFLTSEFGDHLAELDPPMIQRPPRSQSIHSQYMVQPSPPEKPDRDFDFGLDISRTSTLVSVTPPAPVKLDRNKELPDIRTSAYHVEDNGDNPINPETGAVGPFDKTHRASGFRDFMGSSGRRLRASLLGSRPFNSTARNGIREKTSAPGTPYAEEDKFDENNKI